MDQSSIHGSDPEASIAVPQEFIRIDIAVRKQSARIDCASNRIRFDFAASELQESCAMHRG
jgi:hypothetical protein